MKKRMSFRALAAALGILVSLTLAGPSRAAQIELTANQIHTTWSNLNDALIVIAAATAIDDEWTAKFKAMPPEPVQGKTLADVLGQAGLFRKKLNAVLTASSFEPVEPASDIHRAADSAPMVYLNSGRLMDGLILLLVQTDPLSFIAHYYAWPETDDKTADDAYAMAALANQRMDAYMKENGIDMPADATAEAKPTGDGGS